MVTLDASHHDTPNYGSFAPAYWSAFAPKRNIDDRAR
jgi:hypothetical protein